MEQGCTGRRQPFLAGETSPIRTIFAALAFLVFFTTLLFRLRLQDRERERKMQVEIGGTHAVFFRDMFLLTHVFQS